MKIRFTIVKKITVGFGILTFAVILNSLLIYTTLNSNKRLNEEIINIYTPSVSYLNDLSFLINNSKMLIKNWVFVERKNETHDKLNLIAIHNEKFPELTKNLSKISKQWTKKEQAIFKKISTTISDTLFVKHKEIMQSLNSFESYDDPMVILEINQIVEEGGEVNNLTNNILKELGSLSEKLNKKTNDSNVAMIKSFVGFQKFIIYSSIFLIITALIIAYFTTTSIKYQINYLKRFLLTMTKGILPKEKLKAKNDEIGDMSTALNTFIGTLIKTSEFALEIGKGNYKTDFKPIGEQDILGNSLINMRNNLKKAEKEEENRKQEDERRNWVAQGIAKLGDILRQDNDNIDKLSFNIMSFIVDYLKANQGSFFILNNNLEEEKYFELKSAIAYGRSKLMNKKIPYKEGLIGRCAYEKLPIYLKEIPENYIQITSGLGTSNPKNLLLVPLKLNEDIFGIIEIASFNEIMQYQINFLEKAGENIASTISSVKINEQTSQLLTDAQQKGEELAAQEEEMRQNMEELQATQEEALRRETEMRDVIEAINNTVGNLDIDMNGVALNVNDKYSNMISVSSEKIINTKHIDLVSSDYNEDDEDYQALWINLRKGLPCERIFKYNTPSGDVWLNETFTAFKNADGNYDKVVDLVIDITEKILLENKSISDNIMPHSTLAYKL
ncbi:MAG: PAS domain S-box protein [Bacteroidetes bacterium]|nr:PAS domain S-box protein [Bacteroidota bacterium]